MENAAATDRISDLPDSMLEQIVSCLPTKNAVATSILSNRWKNTFTFASKLDINDSSLTEFVDKFFINRTLSLDKLSVRYHYRHGGAKLISWICAALRLNVKFLEIIICLCTLRPLLPSLHGCATLTSLELGLPYNAFCFRDDGVSFCLPRGFSLPNLKSLTLDTFKLDAHIINGFIDGCPVLEELRMCYCRFENIVLIRSHLLKRLDMKSCTGPRTRLDLDFPNLRTLFYVSLFDIQISDFKSLDSAYIDDYNCSNSGFARVIIACSNSVNLYLSSHSIQGLSSMSALPKFQNLTKLKLGCNYRRTGWEILSRLLHNAPNLEKLVFDKKYLNMRKPTGNLDLEFLFSTLPICMELHLKEIIFLEFKGEEDGFGLVEYFSKNGKVLEKLKLHCLSTHDSCSLDRLHKLSMKPNTFLTFECWKDERLLKLMSK